MSRLLALRPVNLLGSLGAVLFLMAVSSPTLADTDQEVYEEVERITTKAQDAVASNLSSYVMANAKPLKEARDEMAELIARLNKEGRKQLATTLQNRLNNLEESIRKRVDAKLPVIPPPQKPLLQRLVGKWKCPTHPSFFVIEADGTIHEDNVSGHTLHKGVLQDTGDGRPVAMQENGWKWRVREAGGDGLAIEIFNPEGKPHGHGIVLERVK